MSSSTRTGVELHIDISVPAARYTDMHMHGMSSVYRMTAMHVLRVLCHMVPKDTMDSTRMALTDVTRLGYIQTVPLRCWYPCSAGYHSVPLVKQPTIYLGGTGCALPR